MRTPITSFNEVALPPHIWPITAIQQADNHLVIGGCDLVALATQFGTPLYILDEATIRKQCQRYRSTLQALLPNAQLYYASKALLNTAVARMIHQEGFGLDVVSGGELFVTQHANVPSKQIHVHGNAKTREELQQALDLQVGAIVVDNLDELQLLIEMTYDHSPAQPIMVRVIPAIEAATHSHIMTGHAFSKFGVPLDDLDIVATKLKAATGLQLIGFHAHLGSQLFNFDPILQTVELLLDIAQKFVGYGFSIEAINPGGGIGAAYTIDQTAPDIEGYVQQIATTFTEGCQKRGLPLLRLELEPGRSIVAQAGVALYQVVATSRIPVTSTWEDDVAPMSYLHINGGMGDNIRPPLYNAHYTATLANRISDDDRELVHVAGRYCESGDILLKNVLLPKASRGDLLAVATSGAYTLSMASNYNLVPRPAVVLVNNGEAVLIQRRETFADLVQRDC